MIEDAGEAQALAPRRWKSRAAPAALAINMAAMIDVVFLLLVYFMLIAQFRPDERTIPVRLASTSGSTSADPFALPERPIIVVVRTEAEGVAVVPDAILGEEIRSFDDLTQRIINRRDLLEPDQLFAVRASPGTRWEDALQTLHAIRASGYERVSLLEPSE